MWQQGCESINSFISLIAISISQIFISSIWQSIHFQGLWAIPISIAKSICLLSQLIIANSLECPIWWDRLELRINFIDLTCQSYKKSDWLLSECQINEPNKSCRWAYITYNITSNPCNFKLISRICFCWLQKDGCGDFLRHRRQDLSIYDIEISQKRLDSSSTLCL